MMHPEGRTPGRQTLLCGGTAFRRDTHATRFDQNPGTNIPGINRINLGGSQAGPRTCHSRTGPGGHSEGQNTRSHPELGRENPQRQWYCVSRRGRVGRRQARPISLPPTAGWSSPVARQAHNLKVRGSNPLPATSVACSPSRSSVAGFLLSDARFSKPARSPASSIASRPSSGISRTSSINARSA